MATPIAPPVPRTDPAEMAPPAARAVPAPAENAKAPASSSDATREKPPERPPATRLMIEDVGGVFVYTVLDRVSGQVIARIPRDSVEKLSETDGYEAGAMIDTQA